MNETVTAMLPVIDIAPLAERTNPDQERVVAARIDHACSNFGFFYATGHGIDLKLLLDLRDASAAFFALPEAIKAEIAMAKGGTAWRGWFPVRGELTSGLPDNKEGLYLGEELGFEDPRVRAGLPLHGANLWPDAVPELRQAVVDYLTSAVRAADAIMRGCALALGLKADHFAKGLTAQPTLLFRLFHYPAPDAETVQSAPYGVGEHSDYGLLTLLAQDDKGGLEIRTRDGWIAVPPLADTLVINIGDMFERLTKGRFRSAPHRVVNRAGVSRYSFPLFFDPDFQAEVQPLPELAPSSFPRETRWDGLDIHEPIGTYGDYLIGKVSKVFPELAQARLRNRA